MTSTTGDLMLIVDLRGILAESPGADRMFMLCWLAALFLRLELTDDQIEAVKEQVAIKLMEASGNPE